MIAQQKVEIRYMDIYLKDIPVKTWNTKGFTFKTIRIRFYEYYL